MRTIDLFAGCGGMSLGFEKEGFEVVAAFDHWLPAINTYRLNFEHPIHAADLAEAEVHDQIRAIEADLIIGGPPCQDFSSAGKRDEDLGRGDLSVTFAEIVADSQPRFFVMENVERILLSNKLVQAKAILENAGYRMATTVLDASFCGVPQKRKRFFMVGSKDFQPDLFEAILAKNKGEKAMTVRDFMEKELDVDHYYRHPRSYLRRGVFSIDEPSPTIRGVNRPIPAGYPGHPIDSIPVSENVRPLTFEERARIQTFPKTFLFTGSKSEREQQIGNAVPVNLASFVARAINEYASLFEKKKKAKARVEEFEYA